MLNIASLVTSVRFLLFIARSTRADSPRLSKYSSSCYLSHVPFSALVWTELRARRTNIAGLVLCLLTLVLMGISLQVSWVLLDNLYVSFSVHLLVQWLIIFTRSAVCICASQNTSTDFSAFSVILVLRRMVGDCSEYCEFVFLVI